MKKLITRCTTALIPFIAISACTFAQASKASTPLNSPDSKEVAYHNESKPGDIPAAPDNLAASINSKALKSFKKSHQKQGNVNWYVITDGFMAQFKEEGITTKAFYDEKGNWTADLRTYQEEYLPKEIRHQVKSTYYDFTIFLVQEVRTNNGTAYLVKMEDKKSIKTVHVQDGEMTEKENFKKSR